MMALGTEVGLGPGHIVLDGAPSSLHQKGGRSPIFGPFVLSPNGSMYQDATWYGGRPQPRRLCVRWGPSFPFLKGTQPKIFVQCPSWPNDWMDEDATWYEVDIGPGHIVLDGVPALHERGTAAPVFSAHVYCGHGRPSQLLLSSCWTKLTIVI